MERLTTTEQKIFDILNDGLMHKRDELHACLPDDLAGASILRGHLKRMRKKLNPAGLDIVCQVYYGRQFRMVRLLKSPYDGKT